MIAIWNPTLTLKICLGATIIQEESPCECLGPHWYVEGKRDDEECSDEELGEPVGCDELAWPPRHNGPIVVSGDGVAHFCEDCVGKSDPDAFVQRYEEAFSLMVGEDLEAYPCTS